MLTVRGEINCAILSDEKPVRETYSEKDFESEKQYYGGYIIAESIPDKKTAKILAAAPEMLEVLETIENDSNQIPQWLWKRIKSVIEKATE